MTLRIKLLTLIRIVINILLFFLVGLIYNLWLYLFRDWLLFLFAYWGVGMWESSNHMPRNPIGLRALPIYDTLLLLAFIPHISFQLLHIHIYTQEKKSSIPSFVNNTFLNDSKLMNDSTVSQIVNLPRIMNTHSWSCVIAIYIPFSPLYHIA